MNYLIYIEHSAENLQFFLWHRDYTARFQQVPESERALAPEWTQAQEDEAVARIQKDASEKMRRAEPADIFREPADIFRGTDFEKPALQDSLAALYGDGLSPFSTPPMTPRGNKHGSVYTGSIAGSGLSAAPSSLAADAYVAAGAEKPCAYYHFQGPHPPEFETDRATVTIQPFRAEIDRVVATYIADRSPRQLNLSSREQKTLLHALSHTTHPSAFRGVVSSIESSLRYQAHPNFIRWSICNGNPARVAFARGLGVGTILVSTMAAILITLSRAPRGYRALPAVGWVIGFATLIAAWKGMCVVLHGLHHCHVRPWELFEPDADSESEPELGRSSHSQQSLESFGSSNSYEDQPWVVKYEKRNVIRKVFDREIWIQEPVLRQIQDTIFVQAVLGAVLLSGVLVGVFVGVPGGGFF